MVEGIRIFNSQRSGHRKRISGLRELVKSVDLTPISSFDLPNTTNLKNGLFGLKGTIGGYADGLLGTLDGSKGRVFFDLRSINSTKPWVW